MFRLWLQKFRIQMFLLDCFVRLIVFKLLDCINLAFVLGELVTFKLECEISLKDTKLGGGDNLDTIRTILAASYFRRKKVFKLMH